MGGDLKNESVVDLVAWLMFLCTLYLSSYTQSYVEQEMVPKVKYFTLQHQWYAASLALIMDGKIGELNEVDNIHRGQKWFLPVLVSTSLSLWLPTFSYGVDMQVGQARCSVHSNVGTLCITLCTLPETLKSSLYRNTASLPTSWVSRHANRRFSGFFIIFWDILLDVEISGT